MLYFYYGAETFLMRQKVNYEISRYKAKHQSGLNFGRFDLAKEGAFEKLKNFVDSFSMFAEKKLAVVENPLEAPKEVQEKLLDFIGEGGISKDEERFLIIVQELKLNEDKRAKEKYILGGAAGKDVFKKLTNKGVNCEEFNILEGVKLEAWIKKEMQESGGQIDNSAVKKIAAFVGSDLWQVHNEVNKLASFKAGKLIVGDDVDALVRSKIESDIFKTIDALAARNKTAAFKFLYRDLAKGESEISLLGMLVYQFRNLLLVKSQIEQGTPFYGLEKKLKMHPFVLRKTFEQAKNFSYTSLKKIYERLMEIDLAIKSGQIEPGVALDLVVGEITS